MQLLQTLTGKSSGDTGPLVTREHSRRAHRPPKKALRRVPTPAGSSAPGWPRPDPSAWLSVHAVGGVGGAARLTGPHPGDSGLRHAPSMASGRTKPPAQGLGIQLESHVDTPNQVPLCLQAGPTLRDHEGTLAPSCSGGPEAAPLTDNQQRAWGRWLRNSSWTQGSQEVSGRALHCQPTAGLRSPAQPKRQGTSSCRTTAWGPQGRLPGEARLRGREMGAGERPAIRAMGLGQSGSGTCCVNGPDPEPPSLGLKRVGIVSIRPSGYHSREEQAQFPPGSEVRQDGGWGSPCSAPPPAVTPRRSRGSETSAQSERGSPGRKAGSKEDGGTGLN